MATYVELLQDPRWQRKRLEILERDKFTCQECGRTDRTLHVHHGYYGKGLSPWEYQNESLHTLCDPCHIVTEQLLFEVRQLVGRLTFGRLIDLKTILVMHGGTDENIIEAIHSRFEEHGNRCAELAANPDQDVEILTRIVNKERRRQGITEDDPDGR